MTDLFTSVDPVMSKKMFHHFLDAHNENNVNVSAQSQHSETVRGELDELEQQFSSLITELEQLKRSKEQSSTIVQTPIQEKKPQLSHDERQELLESVYLLERKLKLLQEQPAHNKQKVELLQNRISQIKEKLK